MRDIRGLVVAFILFMIGTVIFEISTMSRLSTLEKGIDSAIQKHLSEGCQ